MNTEQAIELMRQGNVVQGVDGIYLTHIKHGGKYLYRINNGVIERLKGNKWVLSKGSFDLHSEFILFDIDTLQKLD